MIMKIISFYINKNKNRSKNININNMKKLKIRAQSKSLANRIINIKAKQNILKVKGENKE